MDRARSTEVTCSRLGARFFTSVFLPAAARVMVAPSTAVILPGHPFKKSPSPNFQIRCSQYRTPVTRLRRPASALLLEKVLNTDLFYGAINKILFIMPNHVLPRHAPHGKPLGT